MHTVAIIGTGLIGTSLALALQRANRKRLQYCLVGWDRSYRQTQKALAQGAICNQSADGALIRALPSALAHADIIVLCVPVQQYSKIWAKIAQYKKPTAIISDVGSVKTQVIDTLRQEAPALIPQFVPAHPIAGREKSGAENASADLFDHHQVILTPLAENAPPAVRRIQKMWRDAGAQVSQTTPAEHDDICAAISHLPHLISMALVHDLIHRAPRSRRQKPSKQSLDYLAYAAGGFRDFSRIAGSNPQMWHDIFLTNAPAILENLASFEESLGQFRRALQPRKSSPNRALLSMIDKVSRAQNQWKQQKYGKSL